MASEQERRKKKEREAAWKKILAYYMMEQYQLKEAKMRELEDFSDGIFGLMRHYIKEKGLLWCLFEKGEDGLSAMDLLERMEQEGEIEIPFRGLLDEARKTQVSEEKLSRALTRVIVEGPARILARASEEQNHWQERQKAYKDVADDFVVIDEQEVRYEMQLQRQTRLLRALMPENLYRELCLELARQGYDVDPKAARLARGERNHQREVLTYARDILEGNANGKSAQFRRMLSTLDRYVKAGAEPPVQIRNDLLSALTEYIFVDCVAGGLDQDSLGFTQAMAVTKVLVSEEAFNMIVEQVNQEKGLRSQAGDFEMEPLLPDEEKENDPRELGPGLS